MTKLQLLHRAVNERLMAAVEQIMEMVGGVLLEYEEETIRVRKENEELRRNFRWKQESNSAEWADSSEKPTIPIPEETSPSNEDERPASPRFELNSDVADIENNSTVRPLSGPEIMVTLMKAQENAQSFMAPMEYDLSLQASRFRLWKEQNTRQKMSFACPDCGKVFAKKQTLLVHMRIHSNDSPRYTCRERKTFFYGNSRKGKKKYGLSQTQHHDHSKHDEDDLMDDSVETNNTTAPEAYTDVGQEKLDETTFDNKESILIKYNVTGTKSKRRRKGKKRLYTLMQCPVCPDRTLAGHAQFTMHMRTHKHDMNQCTPSQSTTDEAATMETEVPKVGFLANRCYSKVWDYFSRGLFGEAVCRECSAKVSQGSANAGQRNTTNLWSHLRQVHPRSFLEGKRQSYAVGTPFNISRRAPIKMVKVEPESFGGESETRKIL